MSIGQETGRRLGGRQRMDAAQFMIAAALTIMALALVLAAAAVQAAPRTIPVPEGPAAGAASAPMLLLQEPDGALTPLAPEEGRVTARVNPSTARVTLSYRFRAGPGALRSGVYLLPLPTGAAPRELDLSIGERRVKIALSAEGLEAEPELLALPLAGIGAHAEIRVEIAYDSAVVIGDGRFVLALPVPKAGTAEPQLSNIAWTRSDGGLALELDPGLPISELRSPSHGIDIQKGPGERRRIVLSDPEPAAGRDFVLVWKPADPKASIAALRRYAAARLPEAPRAEDALILHPRLIGRSIALTPATAQVSPLAGSSIEDTGILTAIAAQTGIEARHAGPTVSPALAGITLVIWALGALYLATRAKAGGLVSFNHSTGLLR